MMNSRLYRLTEAHQRIDQALRDAQRRWTHPVQLARLRALKARVKILLRRQSLRLVPA